MTTVKTRFVVLPQAETDVLVLHIAFYRRAKCWRGSTVFSVRRTWSFARIC